MGTLGAEIVAFPRDGCKPLPLSFLVVGGSLMALPYCALGYVLTAAIRRAILDIQGMTKGRR